MKKIMSSLLILAIVISAILPISNISVAEENMKIYERTIKEKEDAIKGIESEKDEKKEALNAERIQELKDEIEALRIDKQLEEAEFEEYRKKNEFEIIEEDIREYRKIGTNIGLKYNVDIINYDPLYDYLSDKIDIDTMINKFNNQFIISYEENK